jgi:hypothetical protein
MKDELSRDEAPREPLSEIRFRNGFYGQLAIWALGSKEGISRCPLSIYIRSDKQQTYTGVITIGRKSKYLYNRNFSRVPKIWPQKQVHQSDILRYWRF